jgi:tRNA pseudouridine55 synthase
MNGVIILDKPAGWTSHDVVNRMRRILGQRSVGHLGTLDPLATGVLPLVTGSLTRLAQFYTASEKTYEGVIRFGFATDTYDADGDPVSETRPITPTLGELKKLSTQFLGLIEQVPPPFSAKKIHGVPAYKLARKQQEVILKPVQVEIKEFSILSVDADRAHFRARVASGTYMRSVAHEMGQRLGSGAHLESLRRTAVAEFDITQAHTLEQIEAQLKESQISKDQMNRDRVKKDQLKDCHSDGNPIASDSPTLCHSDRSLNASDTATLCHSDRSRSASDGAAEEPAVLDIGNAVRGGPSQLSSALAALFVHPRQLLPQFPSVTADEPTAARIRSGRPINLPELSRARQVKVFFGQKDLIAIATRVAGTLFHPKIVFPPA